MSGGLAATPLRSLALHMMGARQRESDRANVFDTLAARVLACLPVARFQGLKASWPTADSESDSRLGTDGNQPGLERREGAADDAALLIAGKGTERGSRQAPAHPSPASSSGEELLFAPQ